jgi:hypothetical protein
VAARRSTVLFLAANPTSLPPLQLGRECRAIEHKIRAGRFRDLIRFRSFWAADPDVQFHTHALMDVGVSDASHLVLAPDVNGRYALTAEGIRGIQLSGHPVVVLAACHSAQGARYQHAPWSLPDALLAVGARAVFAASTEIPDAASSVFFEQVLARVRAGADPAVALRDVRLAAGIDAPGWMHDVIAFE